MIALPIGLPMAQAGDVVRIANGEWPPLLSQHLPGYGPASKIMTEAFGQVGVKVEYGFFPWKRSYELARSGAWDITPLWTRTPERERDFLFSDVVLSMPSVFFHRLGKDFQWQSVDDLVHYRIGITRGYTYGPKLDAAIRSGRLNVVESDNDERNMRLLGKGLIDLFPIALPVGYALMKSELSDNESVLISVNNRPYLIEHYTLLFGKQHAASKRHLQQFNEGLRRLASNGRLSELQQEMTSQPKP
ncbi:transporter substrate-binding domain-containing protein [Chitinivorax sp. B]|uniref:substrate-binding periplasmic protein n=1 Tax=Chitinivorax sp. B TaxID=2502235 RepID=UPI00148512A6|nr:transporter substrate-binding domain-containing protein [Chitinivorax sp. B]